MYLFGSALAFWFTKFSTLYTDTFNQKADDGYILCAYLNNE